MLSPARGGVWGVVPVRCFTTAKSRLRGLLSDDAREAYARALCAHVLDQLHASGCIAQTLVATDCDAVERFARARGAAAVLRDAGEGSLGSILDRALADVAARGAHGAVVLMSDLPMLTPHEVAAVVGGLDRSPVVLAPDRHDLGTNALALAPPGRFPTCFGATDSFQRHLARARTEGADVTVVRSGGLAWDVDTPGDLACIVPTRRVSGA